MSKIPGLLKQREQEQRSLPLIMGILNVTPDSFSDGGQFVERQALYNQIHSMLEAGVDIIDVGGESTRPGSKAVSLEEELARVLPAIDLIKSISDVAISIDTYKPQVMQAAIERGVDLVNDVNALQAPGAIEVVAKANIPVCLMHKRGDPLTMQQAPTYKDVIAEVKAFLLERAYLCEQAGVSSAHIYLDPGFGFGKTLEHNVSLFQHLSEFSALPYPLLVGVSRKKMIGSLISTRGEALSAAERVHGSVAAAIVAASKGAKIVRVHDVSQTVQALSVATALW